MTVNGQGRHCDVDRQRARDGRNNLSTKSYSVTTTGTNKHFEYDANGNLRYEKDGSGTVLTE